MKREAQGLAFVAAAVMGIVCLTGCESGGGGGGSSGSSAIEGNVVSFQTTSAATSHAVASSAQGLSDALAAAATTNATPMGGPGGITVSISGPEGHSTDTEDDGTFSFTDLPAGTYAVDFEYNVSDRREDEAECETERQLPACRGHHEDDEQGDGDRLDDVALREGQHRDDGDEKRSEYHICAYECPFNHYASLLSVRRVFPRVS